MLVKLHIQRHHDGKHCIYSRVSIGNLLLRLPRNTHLYETLNPRGLVSLSSYQSKKTKKTHSPNKNRTFNRRVQSETPRLPQNIKNYYKINNIFTNFVSSQRFKTSVLHYCVTAVGRLNSKPQQYFREFSHLGMLVGDPRAFILSYKRLYYEIVKMKIFS